MGFDEQKAWENGRVSGLVETDVQDGNSWEDNEPHPDAQISALASSALITDRQVGQSGLMLHHGGRFQSWSECYSSRLMTTSFFSVKDMI